MKWYWIVGIAVVATALGYGLSFAVNGGGLKIGIGKTNGNGAENGTIAAAAPAAA